MQLDYAIIHKDWRNVIHDVHTLPGAALNSNHYLVIFIPRAREVRVFGCKVPPKLVAQWSEGRKHIIGQVELYAVVLARTLWSHYINSERCIFFCRSLGCPECLHQLELD